MYIHYVYNTMYMHFPLMIVSIQEVFQRFSTDLTVQRLIAGAVVVNDLRAEVAGNR